MSYELEKIYVVFVDYGIEGWKPHGQTDDFEEAVKMREEAMGYGNPRVWIFKPLKLKTIALNRE